MMNQYLAMGGDGSLPGIPTKEPAFGLPAVWISETVREMAELAGYTVVDPPSVLATHITEFLKNNAAEILSRQDVKALLDNLKKDHPAVVEEVLPNTLSLAEVHKILGSLLKENIPIRDLLTIMEALGDWAPLTKDPVLLTEYARQKLARQIGQLFTDDEGKIYCVTLDPKVEEIIQNSIKSNENGTYLAIDPNTAQEIIKSLNETIEKTGHLGKQVIVLASPVIRTYFRKLIERIAPQVPVLSYNEIAAHLNVESIGMVKI